MFKRLAIATVILTIASPCAFADQKKPAPPPKPKVETIKTAIDSGGKGLEDNESLLHFEVQMGSSDQ